MKKSFLSVILFFLTFCTYAQEVEEKELRHSIGVMISHATIVSPQEIQGEHRVFWVPTWGFIYDFEVSKRFALGLHADIFLQAFKVEESSGEIVTREYPVALALVGEYNLYKGLWLVAGGGVELEREKNLAILTVGLEYAIPFKTYWKLTPSLSFDAKLEGYENWILGLAVARRF